MGVIPIAMSHHILKNTLIIPQRGWSIIQYNLPILTQSTRLFIFPYNHNIITIFPSFGSSDQPASTVSALLSWDIRAAMSIQAS
jgi:hypothetical protein